MAKNTTEKADMAPLDEKNTVRVLSATVINGLHIKSGAVISIPASVAAAMIVDGIADDNAEAVAYALTENAEIIDLDN